MIPLPTIDVLDAITIPVSCPVPWDDMRGDHRTRFCNKCSQNVHDVSELTRAEAMNLVIGGDTIPCLRIYRRPDGRVMTADCTTRRERVWKWLDRRSAWAAALFALVFMGGCSEPACQFAGEPLPSLPAHEEHIADSERAAQLAPRANATGALEEAPAPHEVAPK
jgi:hypothetical protein